MWWEGVESPVWWEEGEVDNVVWWEEGEVDNAVWWEEGKVDNVVWWKWMVYVAVIATYVAK